LTIDANYYRASNIDPQINMCLSGFQFSIFWSGGGQTK